MEQWIEHLIIGLPSIVLFLIIAVTLFTLGKGADWLVDEAVALSTRWGLGKAVIGATIVSVSAPQPQKRRSLYSRHYRGNRDSRSVTQSVQLFVTRGLSSDWHPLIAPLPLNRQLTSRLSNVQVGAGILLVLGCFPWTSPAKVFTQGGVLAQLVGVVFVVLLALYIWQSIRWAGSMPSDAESAQKKHTQRKGTPLERSLNLLFRSPLLLSLLRY